MSWDPRFRVVLADPANRGEAIRVARRLATACHLQRCQVTSDDGERVAALARALPIALAIELEAADSLVMPPVLLHGAARGVELQVCSASPRPPLRLRAQRDVRGDLVTTFEVSPGPPSVVEPYVQECAALAREVGMLIERPAAAIGRLDPATRAAGIPVYADAFPLLALELTTRYSSPYYVLSAEVEPADSVELLASLPAALSVTYAFAARLDDDRMFAALGGHAPASDALLTVRWDEPDQQIWIPATLPDGFTSQDGRVYSVRLTIGHIGCQVIVTTIIDHGGVDNAAAWLAQRAGVPVVHDLPVERTAPQ